MGLFRSDSESSLGELKMGDPMVFKSEAKKIAVGLFFCLAISLFWSCAENNSQDESAAFPVSSSCFERVPAPNDPRYGQAGMILVEDGGIYGGDKELDCLWVGIDDPTVLSQILNRGSYLGEVVGEIIADASQIHGFYMNPATVSFSLGGIPEDVAVIDLIEANPQWYTAGGGGGRAEWGIVLYKIRKLIIN